MLLPTYQAGMPTCMTVFKYTRIEKPVPYKQPNMLDNRMVIHA
jgi:hypothetical protein